MDAVTDPQETAEPSAPAAAKPERAPKPRPERCLNCDQPTGGNFCANCGQENEDETVAFKLLVADLLADLASFDSRLFRTLVPLLLRPGFLTNEYNAGRRVRYLSPFKLYLTTSVLFFVLLPMTHHGAVFHAKSRAAMQAGGREALKQASDAMSGPDVTINIGAPPANGGNTVVLGNRKYDLSHIPQTLDAYNAEQRDPRVPHDPPLKQYLFRQVIKVRQSPQALQQALLDYIPKVMFVLLPCFALSLKLIYFRSARLYIEHLIFGLHLHAFFFLVMSLAIMIHPAVFVVGVTIVLLVYPLVAMRVVYKQGWGKTAFKYCLLATNYAFLLTCGLLAAGVAAFLLA